MGNSCMRYFATAGGDGISDKSNPRVFFNVGRDGSSIGQLTFEVTHSFKAK